MSEMGFIKFSNEAELETLLATPTAEVIASMHSLQGDIMLLGAGGKMGPSLAKMAKKALDAAGKPLKVYAVSRFSNPEIYNHLQNEDIHVIRCDLLDRNALYNLPDCPNIIFMAGQKFGTHEAFHKTWAINTYLPSLIAERFSHSRIMAFSTGNVYPFMPITSGGAREKDPVGPVGEYAQSCVGRERIFQYFSSVNHTPITLFRLNYAVEMRYGVILDIAQRVLTGEPIDLTMGSVNVIWEGEANAYALQALRLCASPPAILNCTGPETLSIRKLAEEFGHRIGKKPCFQGSESSSALLSNAEKCFHNFGKPQISIEQIIEWTTHWLLEENPVWNKPTHFEEREGKF